MVQNKKAVSGLDTAATFFLNLNVFLYFKILVTSNLLGQPYFLLDAQEASKNIATTAITGAIRRRVEIACIWSFTNLKNRKPQLLL